MALFGSSYDAANPGMPPLGSAGQWASIGGQAPGSVLGGGGMGLQPLSMLASGALGMFGPGRRYGSPGMPGGGIWGGGYGYGGYGGYGAQPGAASAFTSDPALNPGAAAAQQYNTQINAANPGGADPNLPYYQGTTPGGGFIAGVGETLAPGRSVTQADADRFVSEARGLGATDEWMRDFLQRNPNDYSRLSTVWHDEFTGGMGDSNDPRTAGQLAGGGTPSGGGGAPGFTHPTYGVAVPDAGAATPMPFPAGGGLPPWLYAPPGGGYRPQVQDQYGRSPSNPNYGRPPQPGETGLSTPPPAPTHDIYGTPLTPGGPASAPPGIWQGGGGGVYGGPRPPGAPQPGLTREWYDYAYQQGRIPGSPGYEAAVRQNPGIDPQTGRPWQATDQGGWGRVPLSGTSLSSLLRSQGAPPRPYTP